MNLEEVAFDVRSEYRLFMPKDLSMYVYVDNGVKADELFSRFHTYDRLAYFLREKAIKYISINSRPVSDGLLWSLADKFSREQGGTWRHAPWRPTVWGAKRYRRYKARYKSKSVSFKRDLAAYEDHAQQYQEADLVVPSRFNRHTDDTSLKGLNKLDRWGDNYRNRPEKNWKKYRKNQWKSRKVAS